MKGNKTNNVDELKKKVSNKNGVTKSFQDRFNVTFLQAVCVGYIAVPLDLINSTQNPESTQTLRQGDQLLTNVQEKSESHVSNFNYT